jgi:hypothetical protein
MKQEPRGAVVALLPFATGWILSIGSIPVSVHDHGKLFHSFIVSSTLETGVSLMGVAISIGLVHVGANQVPSMIVGSVVDPIL